MITVGIPRQLATPDHDVPLVDLDPNGTASAGLGIHLRIAIRRRSFHTRTRNTGQRVDADSTQHEVSPTRPATPGAIPSRTPHPVPVDVAESVKAFVDRRGTAAARLPGIGIHGDEEPTLGELEAGVERTVVIAIEVTDGPRYGRCESG